MTAKTNAARALERLGIAYELLTYPVSRDHVSAVETARRTGMPVECVFKTLVVETDDRAHLFAVIPAAFELDLKALSVLSKRRKVTLVPLARVQPLTGYVRGGTTVLAAKKAFPAFLDERALEQTRMVVSAGRKGLQLALDPRDFARAIDATVGDLSRHPTG